MLHIKKPSSLYKKKYKKIIAKNLQKNVCANETEDCESLQLIDDGTKLADSASLK